jgi:aminoglycoside/choline kinase family phosphotransferase
LKNHIEHINKLLSKNKYPLTSNIRELPSSGSNRVYYRLTFENETTLLAAYNPDVSENIAWYSFSVHFKNKGFRVPEIYARDESYQYFLLEDLGDTNLFDLLIDGIDDKIKSIYKQVIKDLVRFQVEGIDGLDLDVAFPVAEFDRKSVIWDLNYFKYYFIKPHELTFNESRLEEDFQQFADQLLEADSDYFMYRDFQSRNIMLSGGQPWYIDFQGGRKGPLQYDLVSLLYQAKANLPQYLKKELYGFYLLELENVLPGSSIKFAEYYDFFAYFRLMQVLGAYGFRGLIQRKGHFLTSIPFAINNLKQLVKDSNLKKDFPELGQIFDQIIGLGQYGLLPKKEKKLTVTINSFSYIKRGYPIDNTENGGGFAFDCRALPNPGRIAELRNFTGLEKPVIDYLKARPEVEQFLEHASKLVEQSIENYLERGFTNLQINFGCTGGKHRSVYSTEWLYKKLQDKYADRLELRKSHLQIIFTS